MEQVNIIHARRVVMYQCMNAKMLDRYLIIAKNLILED